MAKRTKDQERCRIIDTIKLFCTLTDSESKIRRSNWHNSEKLQTVIDAHLTPAKQKQLSDIFNNDTEQQPTKPNVLRKNSDSEGCDRSESLCIRDGSQNGATNVDIESESGGSTSNSEARRAARAELNELLEQQRILLQTTSDQLEEQGDTLREQSETIGEIKSGITEGYEAIVRHERETRECIEGLYGSIGELTTMALTNEQEPPLEIEMTTIDI